MDRARTEKERAMLALDRGMPKFYVAGGRSTRPARAWRGRFPLAGPPDAGLEWRESPEPSTDTVTAICSWQDPRPLAWMPAATMPVSRWTSATPYPPFRE